MKKQSINILFSVIIATFMLSGICQAADIKIGVIDFQKVLRESRGGKAAKAEIEKKGKSMEATLKARGDELEKIKKKLEAEALVMSESVRENKQRDFRIKVNDFKTMQKKYANDFKKYEMEVIQKVQKEVFKLVEKIGKKGGYTLIVEKGTTLYHQPGIDVTDELIKMYNK